MLIRDRRHSVSTDYRCEARIVSKSNVKYEISIRLHPLVNVTYEGELDEILDDLTGDIMPSRRSVRTANVFRRKPQYEVRPVRVHCR